MCLIADLGTEKIWISFLFPCCSIKMMWLIVNALDVNAFIYFSLYTLFRLGNCSHYKYIILVRRTLGFDRQVKDVWKTYVQAFQDLLELQTLVAFHRATFLS